MNSKTCNFYLNPPPRVGIVPLWAPPSLPVLCLCSLVSHTLLYHPLQQDVLQTNVVQRNLVSSSPTICRLWPAVAGCWPQKLSSEFDTWLKVFFWFCMVRRLIAPREKYPTKLDTLEWPAWGSFMLFILFIFLCLFHLFTTENNMINVIRSLGKRQ